MSDPNDLENAMVIGDYYNEEIDTDWYDDQQTEALMSQPTEERTNEN